MILPRWTPGRLERDDWDQVFPEPRWRWEEDDSCVNCGLYRENHILESGVLLCPGDI